MLLYLPAFKNLLFVIHLISHIV